MGILGDNGYVNKWCKISIFWLLFEGMLTIWSTVKKSQNNKNVFRCMQRHSSACPNVCLCVYVCLSPIWNSASLQFPKVSLRLPRFQGITWVCMQFHEFECSSMTLHACSSKRLHDKGPWAFMQIHVLASSSMSLHAVPWACIQFHDLVCSSMSLNAVPKACIHTDRWACMRCHELSCSSMTCTKFHTVPYFSVWAAHKNFACACL